MKKTFLVLLASIYSFATVGISLTQFYCCGELKSVSLSLTDTKKNCSKSDEKSDCCDYQFEFHKVKDNHIIADEVNMPAKHFADAMVYTGTLQNITFSSLQTGVENRSNAPPPHNGLPAYIFNCVFRL